MTNHLIEYLLSPHENSSNTFLKLQNGDSISFLEFNQQINRIANYLIDKGLQPGDRLALQAGKSWQSLAIYLATVKAGGVFLPLNSAYTVNEISYFLDDAKPKHFVCDPAVSGEFESITQSAGCELISINADGSGELSDTVSNFSGQFVAIPRSPDDLAAILYTSGTTGRSKGAMLSHKNLWSNAKTLCDVWRFSSQDTLLHALPVFHTHGLFVATNTCLVAGASMIFLPRFSIDEVLPHLPKATTMMGVPTFYTRLLDTAEFNRNLVGHIRLFISGSAPLLAETHIQFEARTGHKILERYGMTETNMNTSNPYEGDRRAGTVGLPLPGTSVRVVSPDTGEALAVGDIGSIEVKGDNVFEGYLEMPEKTAEEFTADGYFITGDLGMLSEDGYLTIVGRGKDLIISGGFNIYPKEIELILDEIEGVDESAVIGVPHSDFGEGVVAVLVGKNGPTKEQVLSHIRDKIARFKQPKDIIFLDELPRNTMGKVQKNLLREQFKSILLN
ncbi:MAG: malonyl-CoA synthase [Acidiferrobacterales bacterium]|nr:malonyl-CoA synthase [Acidiferrobacterales bacterium]